MKKMSGKKSKEVEKVSLDTLKHIRYHGFTRLRDGKWLDKAKDITHETKKALQIIARRERHTLEKSVDWFNVGPDLWIYRLDKETKHYSRFEAYKLEVT